MVWERTRKRDMRGKIILDRRKVKVPEITICLVDLKKSKWISVNKTKEKKQKKKKNLYIKKKGGRQEPNQ